MTQDSRPWNGTSVGDAGPYSDADWHQLWRYIIGWGGIRANTGVFLSSGTQPDDGLRVVEQSPAGAGVTVRSGSALVQGIAYMNDAAENLTIAANGAGNPRIDRIILRADYALQTVRLAVLQGTAAASPTRPALTQTPNVMWEIPLADIAVANGFSTIVQANITQAQEWLNAPPGVYLDNVVNNSGGELVDGDVVVWDATADRAVITTTTANNRLAAGVWRGTSANGGYGRVQTQGIGYVRVSAAVTRGDMLANSATAKAAATAIRSSTPIGLALETLGAAGLVLANINVRRVTPKPFAVLEDQKATNTAGGAVVATTWTTLDLNTEVEDVNGIVAIATNQLTPIAGSYRISISRNVLANATNATVMRMRLRNVTTGAIIAVSDNVSMAGNGSGQMAIEASFTANGTDAYDIQYYSTQARATNGLGLAANEGGAVERYMRVHLEVSD